MVTVIVESLYKYFSTVKCIYLDRVAIFFFEACASSFVVWDKKSHVRVPRPRFFLNRDIGGYVTREQYIVHEHHNSMNRPRGG